MKKALSAYNKNSRTELESASEALETATLPSAPMPNLPDDILLHVFETLLTNNKNHISGIYGVSRLRSASFVCKRWWNIIMSTSTFWTKISLPTSVDERQVVLFPELISARLNRAGLSPLSLESCESLPRPLLTGVLRPYLGRITSLMVFPDYKAINEVFDSCSLLPNLTHLFFSKLYADHDPDSEDDVDTSGFVTINLPNHFVPHLSSIELEIEYPLGRLVLPWSQLTTLKLHLLCGGCFDLFRVFSRLTRVENLEIDFGRDPAFISTGVWSKITLPHLRSFSYALCGFPRADVPLRLLEESVLPVLEEFQFRLMGKQSSLIETLSYPQLRSSITKLNLQYQCGDWPMLDDSASSLTVMLEALREFKHLESFQCDMDNRTPSVELIIQALSEDSEEIFLPCLKWLGLTHTVYSQTPHDTLRHLPLLLEKRVSPINVPTNERRLLRGVVISFSNSNAGDLPMQVCQPFEYNDRDSIVEVKGQFKDDNIGEGFATIGLPGRVDRFMTSG